MRALLSVYDKTHIVSLARGLVERGWEIISTGGTARVLEAAGLPFLLVENVTQSPEILDGRVKTLHPHIHGGILARRDRREDRETLKTLGMVPIDLVVVNLYPFETTVKAGASKDEILEMIDIGGPTMLRAAAKNYSHVLAVVDPEDYVGLLEGLDRGFQEEERRALAGKAFRHTASYDMAVAKYFSGDPGFYPQGEKMTLRYGENPHQKGYYYQEEPGFELLGGKPLSYNNLADMTRAVQALEVFTEPTAVAVKHGNPCGIASAKDVETAFHKAKEADPISIFGGIVALHGRVEISLARALSEIFLEVVVAEDFSPEALSLLQEKKNLRILRLLPLSEPYLLRSALGGVLVQEPDRRLYEKLTFPTGERPDPKTLEELLFAWKVVRSMASNALAITREHQTLGLGQGEVRRIWAVEKAVERAGNVTGAVAASDGFFFEDTVEALAKAGIKAVIQPGGSVKDEAVIARAKELGIMVVMTGMRHFKH